MDEGHVYFILLIFKWR